MLTLHIGKLIGGELGITERFEIAEQLQFEKTDPKLVAPVQAALECIRMQDEIVVIVRSLDTALQTQCSRCNAICTLPLHVKDSEAHFFMERPQPPFDREEIRFFVDMKHSTIDLFPFFREEILLQFPAIPLCSSRCKGLCDQCGCNRNISDCSCEKKRTKENPFKVINS